MFQKWRNKYNVSIFITKFLQEQKKTWKSRWIFYAMAVA